MALPKQQGIQNMRIIGNLTLGNYIIPSFTSTEITTLSAVTGMMVFNSTTKKMNFYDGVAWRIITST